MTSNAIEAWQGRALPVPASLRYTSTPRRPYPVPVSLVGDGYDEASPPAELLLPRRLQPRLAVGFSDETRGGMRDIDRALPGWTTRLIFGATFGRLAFIGALVLLFLMVLERNLAFSAIQSRLATISRYDDVGYLLDAMRRLNFDMASGTFLSNFLAHPPHAPVSTLTAMLGFSLFGNDVSSAYFANGGFLAIFVAVLASVSRPLRDVSLRLLFVAIFLFLPASHAMVTEFRPDMVAGLVFALALAAIVSVDLETASLRRRLGIAALAVLATLVKPSGAVLIIPGLGVAFGLTILMQARWKQVPILTMARPAIAPMLAYAAMLAPFALIWGPQTIAYIYQALIGNSDVWRTEGSAFYHWTYHLFGRGGHIALGPFSWLGAAIVALDVARLRKAGASRERTTAYTFYLVLAVLYAAMALSNEKTPFQGSLFYLPFALAVALASVRLLVALKASALRPGLPAGLMVATLLLMVMIQPIASSYTALPGFAGQLPPLLASVTDRTAELVSHSAGTCGHQPILVSTNPDPIAPEAVLLDLAARGIEIDYRTTYMARDQGEVDAWIREGDLVLVPDPAMVGLNGWLPGSAFGAATLAKLREEPGWSVEKMGDLEGSPLWLFVRKGCLSPA